MITFSLIALVAMFGGGMIRLLFPSVTFVAQYWPSVADSTNVLSRLLASVDGIFPLDNILIIVSAMFALEACFFAADVLMWIKRFLHL